MVNVLKDFSSYYPMWVHNLNPTIVEVLGFEIRYYGLVYVIGFLLAWWLLLRYRDELNLTKEQVEDLVFYLILGVVIGARLFSSFFWTPGYYLAHPIKILYIWEGGMAFHGGLIGIIAAAWYFVRKHKKKFWQFADIIALPAVFALGLGRIANFINGELWGTVTDVSWCVVFPGVEGCRHPVTLYGAVGRFVLFAFCYWLWRRQFRAGFVFWNFVFWTGIGRFVIDFLREDVRYYALSLGQWYSLVMVIVAGYFFWQFYRKDIKKVVKGVNKKL